MKLLRYGIICFSFFIMQIAFADAASKREAENLLDFIGMEEAMDQSMRQMIELQIQQDSTLTPFRSVMIRFLNKHMSWKSLKPEFIKIYSEAFSAKELREIIDFYETDAGKKAIKLMPTLMAKGSQIGAARVQENISELQAMMKAESERLQKVSEQ